MSTPAISLRNLRFCYEDNAPLALRDLSLDIPEGAVTAILGPNGSGKTTMLHVLLGRLTPQQGEVLVGGEAQRSLTRKAMSRLIGLVPQDEIVPFEFSVLEYVVLGRAPYLGWLETPKVIDYDLALAAIADAGIMHLSDRTIPSLSGGERQMARLARTLAQASQIMLLDEQTSHLDLSNQSRVLRLLRDLSGRGITVVFTTHDPTAAGAVSDYTVLMREGQTLAAGPTGQVLTGENLTAVYGTPVEVHRIGERLVALSPLSRW